MDRLYMKSKGVKFQITLSQDLALLVEEELKETHMTKTSWISKLIHDHFKQKKGDIKKVISLNIDKK